MEPVAIHSEAVPDDSSALRWVTAAGTFGFVGAVERMPAVLQAVLDDGTLTRVEIEPTAVLTYLGDGRTWRAEGARVRESLIAALSQPHDWAPRSPSGGDDVLRMAVESVIAGDVGAYIRSHGGNVELVGIRDGDVEVRMGGACEHCPAFAFTLANRFETEVRARFPQVGTVTAHAADAEHSTSAWGRLGLSRSGRG
ncbi:NifU family protein [Demequina aurantiaca]|uniref:NifU family protein n=1 Tax=Demequina aurantiaca TaxID=676200 RepID=UPI003D32972B